jgi:lysyl-tRNA synthetase class 2
MAELQADHADLPNGEERELSVAVAGRVMTRRVMGKLAFFTLADETGTIQLFLEKAGLEAQQGGMVQTDHLPCGFWGLVGCQRHVASHRPW